ncbi:MAG: hypothetical protein WAW61_13080 [Methylococcaceae bacterium]
MSSEKITITAELTTEQAWQFAQFLKRVGFTDYRALAENDAQTYEMRSAGDVIREALAEAGYSPR